MRYLLGILVTGLALVWIQAHRVETVQKFADTQVKKATEKREIQKHENEVRAEDIKNSEMVKVLIKAKDVRTCLAEANTTVIDNSIMECNKDHYVEMRRDEAEKMKE
jgi:short subunit fatty acids transporter